MPHVLRRQGRGGAPRHDHPRRPLLGGAPAAWNHDGRASTLSGGPTPWALGTSVWSSAIGDDISDSYPPSGTGWAAYNYDGVY